MSIEVYRDGSTLVAWGATWDWNEKVTRESFTGDFEKNPVIAERDFGATPPRAVQAGLPDPEVVERRANKERQSPVNEDGSWKDWFQGDPSKEYYLHIDMSRSHDATGWGMCHFEVLTAKVMVDLIHNVDPTKDWELTFERVYINILALVERGFHFKKITFDSWQSFYMLERLINAGLPAEIYSVDKSPEAYDTLISTLLMGKLDYYFQARFVDELKHIKLYHGKKYDHEQGKSKDTADGVAGAVCQCLKSHQGLSLTDTDVEKATHEEVIYDLSDIQVGSAICWQINHKIIANSERIRKRVVRIESADDSLMIVIGWHDPTNSRLFVEEFLVWENFTNEDSLRYLTAFIDALCNQVTVTAFSANDQVPLEIIGFMKNTGRPLSTPLSSHSARRSNRRVAGTTRINDTVLRQLVAQIKNGNISIPREPMLIRDLKEMTYTNQKDRKYACALASWMDFAAREINFGHTGNVMPKSLMSAPAPVFASQSAGSNRAAQSVASIPKSIRSGSEVDGIRARHRQGYEGVIPSVPQANQGPKSLPRSTSIRGR